MQILFRWQSLVHFIVFGNNAERDTLENPVNWVTEQTDPSGALHRWFSSFCSEDTFENCGSVKFASEPIVYNMSSSF